MTTIAETIIAIIAEKALVPVASVTPGMTVEELGLDSLAMVETIFAIEESFDIQVPYDSGDPAQTGFDLSSVGSILRAVEGLVAQKAA